MGSLCVCFFMNSYDLLANFVHFFTHLMTDSGGVYMCIFVYILYFGSFSVCISSGCFCFLGFYLFFIFYFCFVIFGVGFLHVFHYQGVNWMLVSGGSGLELNCFVFWIFDIWRVYNVYIIIVIIVFCGSLTGHRSLLIDSYIIWWLM